MKIVPLFVCVFVSFLCGGCQRSSVSVEDTGKSLTYSLDGKPLFSYNYAVVYPAPGVDTVYKRSGFIHPLKTLGGEVLTNCSPSDHYHHFGLWYAWTKTTFEGNEIDFWNLNKKQGTVRFRSFDRVTDTGFVARLDHVVYPDSPAEKVAMNERLEINIGKMDLPGYYIDYHTTVRCAGSSPITMEAYQYGGICIRTRGDWNDRTAEMLTSEGLTRDQADCSRARWCYFQGKAGKEDACILIVASPSNLNYPEPLRVWDKTVNKPAGDVMWNFSPTKQQAFTLEPGKELSLSYRIYILDRKIDAATAEALSNSGPFHFSAL
ncbi:MAG: PmoA family protein [Parabacteroides sp.]|nr:PmoA family protein [Parabacteroides sp.]